MPSIVCSEPLVFARFEDDFGRGAREKMDWALQPEDVGEVVLDLLRAPARALYSRVEMRPSRPPRKG